jgi:sugar phosphate isomerase/epimerase
MMTNSVLGVGYSIANHDDFGFHTLGARLDEAEALGVDFVELPLYAMDLIAAARPLASRVKAAKAITGGRSLRYTVHGPLATNLMDIPERLARHQDVLKAALEVCAELGGIHYVMHTGLYEEGRAAQSEHLYGQQRDILAAFGDVAETLGVIIAVENLFGSQHGQRTALMGQLAREIAAIAHPYIWACLDFSHGYLRCTAEGATFMDEAAALAPFAKHLHIHDSHGRPALSATYHRSERLAYGEGDLHLPLGLGAIPWDELMRRLEFPGGLVFNIELAPPYWSALADTIAETRRLAARARTAGS